MAELPNELERGAETSVWRKAVDVPERGSPA